MVIQYVNRAFKITAPTGWISWVSTGSPDPNGIYAPYSPAQLTLPSTVDYTITSPIISPGGVPFTTAGGDLAGTYPNPTVIKIDGYNVNPSAPQDKQVLTWSQADGYWKSQFGAASIYFNVKNYGAKGDGITNDTVAIQNTINVAAVNGGIVFFPSGTYIYNATLDGYTSVSLVGSGMPKWDGVHLTGTGSWLKWTGAGTGNTLQYVGARDFSIENIGFQGMRGGIASSLVGLYMAGNSGPSGANFKQQIRNCIFSEHDTEILWGEGLGYQADSSVIENCEFWDYTSYGVHINSVNAADASKIERCVFYGVNGWGIYVQAAGFMRIVDCDGAGPAPAGFIKIYAGTNQVVIENCEAENSTYFLYVDAGSGAQSNIFLRSCTTNQPIYLGTIVRVVGMGNLLTGTVTLNHPGAKWISIGDVIPETLGGNIIVNSGVFHNQDLLNAGQGSGFFPKGQVHWNPYYWYGASQGDGTSQGKIAAEWNTRSGIRGLYWIPNNATSAGSYIVPSIDNGHAYKSLSTGTTGATEPVFPTGAGATVVDGYVTWQEDGYAALFVPFGPLNQSSGVSIPSAGYYLQGHMRWNTAPSTGNNIGWVCTASGNPGTWQSIGQSATAVTQSDWYVDFVNGNDGYAGTISKPVKTIMGGIVPKWGTSSPTLPQTTTIHVLNSQTLGAEKIVLSPTMINTSLFKIIGTPATSGTTFALGTVTAKNIASKQVLKANGFTGKVQGQLVVNTTRSNSRALILSVVGDTATLTQPMAAFVPGTDTNYFPTPTLYDTWTAGDTIQVYNLPKLNLIDISCFGTEDNVAYSGGDALILQNLYIPDQSGSIGSSYFGPRYQNGIVTMDGCVIEPFGQTANKTPNVNCLNTMWLYGGEFELTYFAGGAVTSAGGVVYTGINWLDGYTMIDTTAASSCIPLYCGFVSFTSGSQLILHPNSSMEIRQLWYAGAQGGAVFGDGYLHLQPNSSCVRRTPTPSWVSCLNLTTLTLPSNTTTGTSYSAGTFTDGRALTSANLDTYGGLQDPKTGAIFANDL